MNIYWMYEQFINVKIDQYQIQGTIKNKMSDRPMIWIKIKDECKSVDKSDRLWDVGDIDIKLMKLVKKIKLRLNLQIQ